MNKQIINEDEKEELDSSLNRQYLVDEIKNMSEQGVKFFNNNGKQIDLKKIISEGHASELFETGALCDIITIDTSGKDDPPSLYLESILSTNWKEKATDMYNRIFNSKTNESYFCLKPNFKYKDVQPIRENNTIKKVEILDGAKSIPEYAFSGCTSLKEINISRSMKSISPYAFHDYTSLEEINIPHSVKTIGTSAFVNCIHLNKITVSNKIFRKYGGKEEFCRYIFNEGKNPLPEIIT